MKVPNSLLQVGYTNEVFETEMFFKALEGLVTPFTSEEQARCPTWTAEEKELSCTLPKHLKPPIKNKEILPLHDMDIPRVNAASFNGKVFPSC